MIVLCSGTVASAKPSFGTAAAAELERSAAEEEKMHEKEEWVRLVVFGSLIEAEIARTKLMSDHIPAYITKDDEGGMTPGMQLSAGVRLYVPKSLVQPAKQSLGLDQQF